MDLKSSTTSVDMSPAARFSQSTMYWQHPHLPWLTLFPRMSKANNGHTIGEAESAALANDWKGSFRALYFVSHITLGALFQCNTFFSFNFEMLFRICCFSWSLPRNVPTFMCAPIPSTFYSVRLASVAANRSMLFSHRQRVAYVPLSSKLALNSRCH